jgi:PAS domain-containing protein
MEYQEERRKEPRVPCSGLVEVTEVNGTKAIRFLGTALVENVSHGGACLQMDQPPTLGSELVLRNQSRTFEVRGVVRNLRRADIGFLAGLEFTAVAMRQFRPSGGEGSRLPVGPTRGKPLADHDPLINNTNPGRAQSLSALAPLPDRPRQVRMLTSLTKLLQHINIFRGGLLRATAEPDAQQEGANPSMAAYTLLEQDPLALFEEVPTAAVALDSDFTVAYANSGFIRLVGSTSLLAARTFERFVASDDIDRVLQCARAAVCSPGTIRSVSFHLCSEDRQPVEVDSLWRHSPKTLRTMVQLFERDPGKSREREFLCLLSQAGTAEEAGIAEWTMDLPSQTLQCSRDLTRLFGLDPRTASLERLAWMALIHPEDQPRVDSAVQEAVREGTFRAEFRARHVDPSVATFVALGHVVLDSAQQPVGISGATLRARPRSLSVSASPFGGAPADALPDC